MSGAAKCDHCGVLFEPAVGDVSLEYSIRTKGGSRESYSPDSDGGEFDLCTACSAEFLAFIKHAE